MPSATSTRSATRCTGAAGPVVTEVFAFGRMPLAFSARCFTARHHRLKKDECDFRCRDDADGLLLATSEGERLPGAQRHPDPVGGAAVPARRRPGAGGGRRAQAAAVALQPRLRQALAAFDAVLNEGAAADEAVAQLAAAGLPGTLVDGFARQRPGIAAVAA